MKKTLPAILLLLRIAIGLLFIGSGYTKLLEPVANFAGSILGYQIVGAETAANMAVFLPWAELILGVFLVLGLWLEATLVALALMNLTFIGAIISALIRQIPLESCGCFGEGGKQLPIQATLALDIVILGIYGWMAKKREAARHYSLDRILKA